MWYFAWILGLFAAAMFAVVNAMWLELQQDNAVFAEAQSKGEASATGRVHHA
ncbi:cytochrome bd-I oxidase subunit CydX [Roseibium denhamense]|uniref:Cyd operon protein YbgT n=1 Tax=Roseibium denhamense TaxID=76305 RepID=A0ABY1NX98_9HYPH|nr:cytochrome bd-I oxidase subunit CydX [Roseibium denhamense]MTI04057.1 cytochrome bd-I oxidase subunit CydX [Roseibium denhamense]SMP20765.1 cyd operon protein YbgT [Roseibium denhamense]